MLRWTIGSCDILHGHVERWERWRSEPFEQPRVPRGQPALRIVAPATDDCIVKTVGHQRDGRDLRGERFSKADLAQRVRAIRTEPAARREVASAQRLFWQGFALQLGGFLAAALTGIIGPRSGQNRLADAAFVGLLALSVYGTVIMIVAIHRRESSLRDIARRQLQAVGEPARTP